VSSPAVSSPAAPVVLIAEELSPATLDALGPDFDIRHCDGADRSALLTAIVDADAILVRSATRVDAEALGVARRLKVVARAGVGLDNVDVPAATQAGVMVVNAPQSNVLSAAEHAVALLLAQARNIPQADRDLKAGEWNRSRWEGVELNGKTLGIVGLGKIGQAIAVRAADCVHELRIARTRDAEETDLLDREIPERQGECADAPAQVRHELLLAHVAPALVDELDEEFGPRRDMMQRVWGPKTRREFLSLHAEEDREKHFWSGRVPTRA